MTDDAAKQLLDEIDKRFSERYDFSHPMSSDRDYYEARYSVVVEVFAERLAQLDRRTSKLDSN